MLKLENSNDDALSVTNANGASPMNGLCQATISYWAYTTRDAADWGYYAAQNGNQQPIDGNNRERYIGALHNNGNITAERFYQGTVLIILQDYDLLANVLIDGFCPHHRCR